MKMVGAFLCFVVSISLGFAAGKKERARTEECIAFFELFTYIQNQIGYFFAPTKLIYKNIQSDILAEIGFLDALSSHEQDEVYFDVWSSSLIACKNKMHLTDSQFEIVKSFGSCIGKSNEELQLKNMEYYAKAMSAEVEKQKAEMKKNVKLYRTLGFAVGAAMLILVL